jgi:hypothetical protein
MRATKKRLQKNVYLSLLFLRGCVHMEVEVKHGFKSCGPEKAKLEAMAT